jgi:hypothetical protein
LATTLTVGREANNRAIKVASASAFEKRDIFDTATSFLLHAVE